MNTNEGYTIILSKKADKFLNKRNLNERNQLINAIINIPFGDIVKLQGSKYYRLRVNDYRIIFDKDNKNIKIYIINLGNRGQIYK